MQIVKSGDFTQKTMSSREIAEITGKQHAHVMRDLRSTLDSIAESKNGLGVYEANYLDSNGQQRPMYLLDKKATLLIVSGYDVNLRLAIINRWEELETQNATKLPSTYIEALESLILAEKQKEALLLESQEKQARIEKLIHNSKLYTVTELAKEVGLRSAQELNKILSEKKIQYKVNETYVLSAKYASLGYTSIKQDILENGKVIYDRRFTPEGREFILSVFAK